MTTSIPLANNLQTLEQRLAEGPIPEAQALRYIITLGESLRRIHDAGQVHGDVAPANIVVSGMRLELGPAVFPVGDLTPYTAPELLLGQPADARSDIYSFGVIAYEVAGRSASQGDNSIVPSKAASPELDRVLAACTAQAPAARFERMQKILLELKLLAIHAKRKEAPARLGRAAATMRTELAQIESRVGARLEAQERAASDSGRSVGEAMDALRGEFAALSAQVARAQRTIDAIGQRVTLAEQGLEHLQQVVAAFRENAPGDLRSLSQRLAAQAAEIESARGALAQTDDLVERMVDALDLQLSASEQGEAGFPGAE